jgi:hypothetical protein
MCRDVHVAKPPDVSKRRGSAKIYIGLPRVDFPDEWVKSMTRFSTITLMWSVIAHGHLVILEEH